MTSHDDIRRAMRPHLLRLMPARFELPGSHWRRLCGYRLHLHIPMPRPPGCGRGGGGRYSLAEVCWNGGGVMSELRFQVWDPACHMLLLYEKGVPNVWGASNHFCRCPGLSERLSTPRDLNGRGLYDPTRADVLEVIRWCDAKARELYARIGLPFLAYRAPGFIPAGWPK